MMDRERMLQWQAQRERSDKRWRLAELVIIALTVAAVIWAAFIERGGQPTINNIIDMPTQSTPDKEGSQP